MRNRLKTTLLITGLAAALGGASAVSAAAPFQDAAASNQAAPATLDNGVSYAGEVGQFEKAQYFYGGRNYCWYDSAWEGPGYYWCGYAWRRGFGFGGRAGWHGFRGGGFRGGGGGFHGDRGGGHGGGHDGGHDRR
ncbi:MAG TPA: hypothetical protein VE309_00760 [Caulobacteraceae bacterium]|jgi:hypothetical protein|nr:hypothetical protein [Caulobacteraceae bacterium]